MESFAEQAKKLTREQCMELLPWDFLFETQPFLHQLQALVWSLTINDPAFFMDLGTGKTFMAINWLKLNGIKNRILIITVNFPVAYNWIEEFARNYSSLKGVVLKGTYEERIRLLEKDYDFFVINYDGLRVVGEELMQIEWNAIVADESRRMKSINAQRTQICIALSSRAKRRAILSGLPLVKPMDIFAQYLFLDGGKTFGTNFYSFRNYYFYDSEKLKLIHYLLPTYLDMQIARMLRVPINFVSSVRHQTGISYDANKPKRHLPKRLLYAQKWTLRKDREHEFMQKLNNNCIRFRKEECLQLPEKIYQTYYVDLSYEQRRDYERLLAGEGTLTLTTLTPLQLEHCFIKYSQITGGFLKTTDNTYKFYPVNPKLDVLLDIIEDSIEETKIVIFHRFIAEGQLIERALEERDLKFASMRSEIKDTNAEYRRFLRDEDVRIMVAHPLSGGIGLNFTNSHLTVYYSLDYSIESKLQSEDRTHRIGTKSSVVYIHLLARGTIDEEVWKAHKEGISLINRINNYHLKLSEVIMGKGDSWREIF